MKKISLLVSLFVFLVACTHSTKITFGNAELYKIKLHEGKWVSNFKNEVFIRCISRLYPSELNNSINSFDASSSANLEWLKYNSEIISVIDSLATSFSKRNEANWTIENRKIAMNLCLAHRNDIVLDSISMKYYKKVVQNKIH